MYSKNYGVEHYLHLGLNGKDNGPYPCLELSDSRGLMYSMWYADPGDDGTREE
jgi:hypothetical protein